MSIYIDLDLSFNKHPLTGDLLLKKDNNSIKQSLYNLIKTSFGERGFNIIGTNIYSSLFENHSNYTNQTIRNEIETMVENYETRVDIEDIIVYEKDNSLVINILYNILNTTKTENFEILLERVR